MSVAIKHRSHYSFSASDLDIIGTQVVGADREQWVASRVGLLQSRADLLWDYFSIRMTASASEQPGGVGVGIGSGAVCISSIPLLLPVRPEALSASQQAASGDGWLVRRLLEWLPAYVWLLATSVEWGSERACYATFARATARYYCSAVCAPLRVSERRADGSTDTTRAAEQRERERALHREALERVLFPHLKALLVREPAARRFLPSRVLLSTGSPSAAAPLPTNNSSAPQPQVFTKLVDIPQLYKVFERC